MSESLNSVYVGNGVTNPLFPKSMNSREPGFISRFYKPKQQGDTIEERYSNGNQNLVLKQDFQASRNIGLQGFLGRLDEKDEIIINRSNSGKAPGSSSSSGYSSHKNSSGKHQPFVELESEEEEVEGQSVVKGALELNNADHNLLKTSDKKSAINIQSDNSTAKLMSDISKMPDGLSNSIASFLKRTDKVTEDLKNGRRERELSLMPEHRDMSYGRDIRSTSVARASSVARQFEPSPTASFTRAGSVTRHYDLSSRDPYYSNISRSALSRPYRESSVPLQGYNGHMRDYNSRPLGLSPLLENRILSPNHSFADPSLSYRSSALNTFKQTDFKKPSNSRFRTLEDECNWILSGRDPLPDVKHDKNDDDENTLDDISGDEGFKSCCTSLKSSCNNSNLMLSEMTADLTEEQNASTIATERLETEQAERMKLEREKADLISRNKTLNSNAERYELELMHSRTLDINGIEDGDGGVYRVKYERAMKDMDHMKKMMAQQHEDDLEQLGLLKKQLEKKLNDAYEEVDEQRQVGAQWKRKTQKIQGEMNDLRLLLEEQTSRNSLLEKKQRKFDTELAMVQEDRRQDQLAKEKVQKDLEHLRQEKNRMEDTMKGMKIDLESRDEKISALNREISDIQMGGATEDEVRSLKKTKKDLEMQLKDQEEELDDLAAQVQMLEGSKTKIEMEMAAIKKEHRREMTNRDEEIEEARASASKKVKILEQQLEQEHEERIMFLRERHELEQKIGTLQDMLERSGDEEQVAKLKKDLRKTKALLRDAQLLVEKTQNEGTNKVILRQLKNQLEDAEFARTAAMKARQNAELELADTQLQLEDVSRSKQDLEEKHLRVSREKAEFASQLQENEEELQDVMRKYKASVAAVSTDQITIQDQQSTIQELEEERNKLRDAVAELSSKLGNLEGENVSTAQHKRLELKIRELESKLELELTSRSRLETQIIRLKETIEKITKEKDEARLREQQSSDQIKKHSRQIREMKEDYVTVQGKEIELSQKKNDLEKQLEVAEAETLTVRSDLKLALKRIEDLQAALAGEMDSDNSDDNSDSSDDEMHSFLEHHRRAMSVQRERESMARESIVRESMGRDSSILRESVTREVRSNGARTFASIDESRESISMDASKLSSTIAEIDESQA